MSRKSFSLNQLRKINSQHVVKVFKTRKQMQNFLCIYFLKYKNLPLTQISIQSVCKVSKMLGAHTSAGLRHLEALLPGTIVRLGGRNTVLPPAERRFFLRQKYSFSSSRNTVLPQAKILFFPQQKYCSSSHINTRFASSCSFFSNAKTLFFLKKKDCSSSA